MVGSIRKQPANFPGGGSGSSGRAEQIARRNQEVLAAAERGDRRRRPNQNRRRKQLSATATATATAEASSALNDSFRMKTTSHFEILMPDDITLSSSSKGGGTIEAPPTAEQLENAEARDRKSVVDAKIAALLADDEEDDGDGIADGDLADKQTVYTRLSDMAKSQASAAISKSNSYGAASSSGGPSRTTAAAAGGSGRVVSKKKRVTAQVQETGRDTIQSYTKSFTNHELLSRESEAALGREIQMLARWEERRQDLEVQLMR